MVHVTHIIKNTTSLWLDAAIITTKERGENHLYYIHGGDPTLITVERTAAIQSINQLWKKVSQLPKPWG